MTSWVCFATPRCEAVRLGLWVCGSVWLHVFAGSRPTEPQAFSLSKFTGTCVLAWPSLCSCSPHPREPPGSQPMAIASWRPGRRLPCSPAPSPASGAGGTSPILPCSLTHQLGLSNGAAENLASPMTAFMLGTHLGFCKRLHDLGHCQIKCEPPNALIYPEITL